MKMVKSLLLGSAVALIAMTGAQAADLPVKAKPVQYVKICSLYGAGFYYIPGTDTCLKIGGWVRLQHHYNINGNSTNGPLVGNTDSRLNTNSNFRSRGYITADARNQTEYGTLRSYLAVGFSVDNSPTTAGGVNTATPATGAAFDSNRAFIQLAGFTFGKTISFYDFYNQPATQYFGFGGASDTGDGGKIVMAYTAQFGNGLSATISAEDPRRSAVISSAATSTILLGALPATAGNQIGERYPDVLANLRVDQAWGSAQIMAAVHDASAGYYNGVNQTSGHPDDKVGYALGAGIKVNTPMIGNGDYFQAQFNWTKGAAKYAVNTPGGTAYSKYNGTTSWGYGVYTDAVYGAALGSSLELTTVWGVNAAYEHFWSPKWQTSLWGAYNRTTYSDAANVSLCAALTTNTWTAGPATCNNSFSMGAIGTRTQFNVDASTYIGLEVVYTKLYSANSGQTATLVVAGSQAAGVRTIQDQDAWATRLQIHRNFFP